MQRQLQPAAVKAELETERAYGRRNASRARTARDDLLAQFRQARRRLGATARR